MASKRILKKNLNYLFGDIIDECYIWMLVNSDKDISGAESIIDEAVDYYNGTIDKINAKGVENYNKHFSLLKSDVEEKANELVEKINKL